MAPDPRNIAEEFASAWNKADADALAAIFTDDADFVNVVGFWWTNRNQIRNNHAYGFQHIFPDTSMVLDRVTVRDLGDVAVVHAGWTLNGQVTPAGELAGSRSGIISFTTVRQDDGHWLAVSAQNTDKVPGMQTHMAAGDDLVPQAYGPFKGRE